MPFWSPPYKIRRSTHILDFSVRQNHSALQIMGEPCYLLQRMARANAPIVQEPNRRVSTVTKTITSFSTDPDTGYLRAPLWQRSVDSIEEYPDIGVFTCTVAASATTSAWDPAVDKYSFIGTGYNEYSWDIFQDQIDSNNDAVEDAMYIVFGPDMHISNTAICTYGIINPLSKFEGMQPIRDNHEYFQRSLFGFEQWLSPYSRIRRKIKPNGFLLAFPSVETDIKIGDGGAVQISQLSHWCGPPMKDTITQRTGISYPDISEMDVIVRELTSERYQVIDYKPIYIENRLVSQQFNLVELDPRSSIYNIIIQLT